MTSAVAIAIGAGSLGYLAGRRIPPPTLAGPLPPNPTRTASSCCCSVPGCTTAWSPTRSASGSTTS